MRLQISEKTPIALGMVITIVGIVVTALVNFLPLSSRVEALENKQTAIEKSVYVTAEKINQISEDVSFIKGYFEGKDSKEKSFKR